MKKLACNWKLFRKMVRVKVSLKMQNERMGEMETNAEWIAETDWKKSFNFIAHLVVAFIFHDCI